MLSHINESNSYLQISKDVIWALEQIPSCDELIKSTQNEKYRAASAFFSLIGHIVRTMDPGLTTRNSDKPQRMLQQTILP